MITLDSASGNIDIPKVNSFDELMNKIKEVLKINDELFKYLYFSYIDEEENERTRLIPQIYDDFISQESPTLSIGFLDNLNENIEKEFIEIIESNKIRFKKDKKRIILNKKEDNEIKLNNSENNEKENKDIIFNNNEDNKIISNDKENDEIILIEKENNNEIILNKEEENINNNDNNIKNIEIISNEKDNKENINNIIGEENIVIFENKNIDNKDELNNNNDLNLKKYDSDNNFCLFRSDSNTNNNNNLNSKNIGNNNDENKFKNSDNSEFNLKEINNEFSNDINKLQISMKHSNIEEYKKDKEQEELEFENNIKNIIDTNVNNIKNDILNSIIVESSSKKDNKSIKSQKNSKDNIIHIGIQCNNCGELPIQGIRYKCVECDNYNLCSKCEENKSHPHLFYKIKKNLNFKI